MLVRQHILSVVSLVLQGTYSSTTLPPMLDVFKGMALGKKHWACAETNCRMQNAGMNNWCIATYQEKGSGDFPLEKQWEYGKIVHIIRYLFFKAWILKTDCTSPYAFSASLSHPISTPSLFQLRASLPSYMHFQCRNAPMYAFATLSFNGLEVLGART